MMSTGRFNDSSGGSDPARASSSQGLVTSVDGVREQQAPLWNRRDFMGLTAKGVSAVGLGALIASCSTSTQPSAQPSTAKPKRGGQLRAGLSGGGSSDTLNALDPINTVDVARIMLLYETLNAFDENANVV